MPNLFRINGYTVYFWTNEGDPVEPIHVHVAKGKPGANATKIWLSQSGHCVLCNNNSEVPGGTLSRIMKSIEANRKIIEAEWKSIFGEISYYC